MPACNDREAPRFRGKSVAGAKGRLWQLREDLDLNLNFNLLAGIHTSREGLRRDLLLDWPLHGGHRHVGNARVVETLLERVHLVGICVRLLI